MKQDMVMQKGLAAGGMVVLGVLQWGLFCLIPSGIVERLLGGQWGGFDAVGSLEALFTDPVNRGVVLVAGAVIGLYIFTDILRMFDNSPETLARSNFPSYRYPWALVVFNARRAAIIPVAVAVAYFAAYYLFEVPHWGWLAGGFVWGFFFSQRESDDSPFTGPVDGLLTLGKALAPVLR